MKPSQTLPRYKSVILAGGGSRRMGQDKALLPVYGQRLIDRVFSRLSLQCEAVLISGAQDYDLGLENIPDSREGPRGPVGGIYTLWERFQAEGQAEGIDGFITVPVDGPNLPLDFCSKMVGPKCAISQTIDGLHPTFAYWNMSCLDRVFNRLDLKSSQSLKALAALCKARTVMWPDPNVFYNINTPDDLLIWEQSQLI